MRLICVFWWRYIPERCVDELECDLVWTVFYEFLRSILSLWRNSVCVFACAALRWVAEKLLLNSNVDVAGVALVVCHRAGGCT